MRDAPKFGIRFVRAWRLRRSRAEVAECFGDWRADGIAEVVAYTLQNLGHVLGYRGVFEEGRSIQKRAIDAFRKQEQPRGMGLSQVYLAELELSAGDLTAAELEARAAIESLAGVPPLRAGALAVHARVVAARGKCGGGARGGARGVCVARIAGHD
ncbi:MAG: hypothetical protein IPM54_21195 [Polyangiaceae bacterium]|nr:hypothetical protein [Polyangiaceae bacterium]